MKILIISKEMPMENRWKSAIICRKAENGGVYNGGTDIDRR